MSDSAVKAFVRPFDPHLISSIIAETELGVAISDVRLPDQPLVYVNPAFEAMTGYAAAEVLGRNCRFLQGLMRDHSEASRIRQAIAAGRFVRTVLRNYKKSGELFWNEVTLAPVRGFDGRITHYFSVCSDVSVVMRGHEATDRRSEPWQTLLNVSPGLMWIIDPQCKILFVNDAISSMTGLPADSCVGKDWLEILRVENADIVRYQLKKLVDHEADSVAFEVVHQNAASHRAWLGCRARNALQHPHIRGIIIAAHDISGERLAQQLAYEAAHDALTGIHNRYQLRRWYDEESKQLATQTGDGQILMWLIDLDNFKSLNDSFGHSVGDEYLRHFAHALKVAMEPHWVVARLGGDEFAVLGSSSNVNADIPRIATRILAVARAAYPVARMPIALSASVGVAATARPYASFDDLMRNADIAMYAAKNKGRNTFATYDVETGARALNRHRLLRDLAGAIARKEFVVAYQPIVDSRTGEVRKYEALLRWRHPEMGLLSADRFIDELSLTGLCEQVTLWVLQKSLRKHQRLLAEGKVRIALNVWARQFAEPHFAYRVAELIRAEGLRPECLDIEIVETEVLLAGTETAANLARLREYGVKLIIDDFGKGFSSLAYLQRLNVHGIKIDGSFVANLGTEKKSEILIRALLSLANELGLEAVAECVETDSQRSFLEEAGCHLHQGYLYGRPSIDP